MKKVLVGILAVAILAGGGYLGFDQWSRARARGEVEQVFTALRLYGATASHGPVAFDLSTRTLTLDALDIAAADGGATVKAASLVVRGLSTPRQGHFAARVIEIGGLSVQVRDAGTGLLVTYAVPAVRIEDYEGPTALLVVPPGNGRHEALRFALQHFAGFSATRMSAPDLQASATFTLGAQGARTVNAVYSAVEAQGIAAGRIARLTLAPMTFSTTGDNLAPEEAIKGRLEALTVTAIDTGPLLALTQHGNHPTGYATVYGQLSASGYAITGGDGTRQSIATLTARNVAVDPASLALDKIDAVATLARSTAKLGRLEEAQLMDHMADLIAGAGFDGLEMEGLKGEDPTGTVEIAAVRLGAFSAGTLARFSIEGLKGHTADGQPLRMDKVAVSNFSLVPVFTMSAEALRNDAEPTASSLLVLFQMLDGIELSGIQVPREDDAQPVGIEALSFSWGEFIGDTPTRIAFSATGVSGPVSVEDGPPFSYLAAAGRKSAKLDGAFTLAYDQAARTLTLDPAELKVDGAFSLSARATLGAVPRRVFEDPIGILSAAGEITMGPATLTVTNLGIADMILKEEAAAARVEPEDLRAEIVSAIAKDARALAADSPDAAVVGQALAEFVRDPHSLTLTVTPKGNVPLLDLMGADPQAALGSFSVTATTGK